MALHRYSDFRVEVFYFDSPCIVNSKSAHHVIANNPHSPKAGSDGGLSRLTVLRVRHQRSAEQQSRQ